MVSQYLDKNITNQSPQVVVGSHLTDMFFATLDAFVVILWECTRHVLRVNEAQTELFGKESSIENISPTLRQMIYHGMYQSDNPWEA